MHRCDRQIAEGREVTEGNSPRTVEQCLPHRGRCDPVAGYARESNRGLHTRLRGRIPTSGAPAPRSSARSTLFVARREAESSALLLRSNPRPAREIRHAHDLGSNELVEFFGRARRRLGTERDEALLHVGHPQYCGNFSV